MKIVLYYNCMQEKLLNQITLDYLIDKEKFDKYISQSVNKKINKKDKKFYKKRIFSLTKELLIDSDVKIYPEIKYTFDNYINSCINYFKSLDNNDIIQEDLNLINNNKSNISCSTDDNVDHANLEYIKSLKISENSLDNFVIKEKLGENKIILPRNKNINLKDPELKLKGVKNFKKKKNINNIYEEKKSDKKESKNENSSQISKNNDKKKQKDEENDK